MNKKHGACDEKCSHLSRADEERRAAFLAFAGLHEDELHQLCQEPLSCSDYRRMVGILLALPEHEDRIFLARVMRRLVILEEEREARAELLARIVAAGVTVEMDTGETVTTALPKKPEVCH